MKKGIIVSIVIPLLISIINGCDSPRKETETKQKVEALIIPNCDSLTKEKKQVIQTGDALIKEDSITTLVIDGYEGLWPLGNYDFLKTLEIKRCNAPLSFDFLKNSKCLSKIIISSCKDVASLKIPFEELASLKDLDLYSSDNIPNEIFRCPSLKMLGISECNINNLSLEELGKLKNLEVLSFEGLENFENNFDWAKIGKLQKLKYLRFLKSKVTSINKEIGNCKDLETLMLFNNDLQKIDPALCSLKKLTFLQIIDNPLKRLPDCFGELSNLETLDLNNDSIESLPLSFTQLNNLNELNIQNNKLEKFPEEVLQLKNLNYFSIYGTKYQPSDSLYNFIKANFKGPEKHFHLEAQQDQD